MKKIFLSFALIAFATSTFAQSFSVDNRSLSVPRYANQAAITSANPTPTNGMLVYDNALNQYAYFNGSAWINFPAAATNSWVLNSSTNRLVAQGATNGVQSNFFTANGVSTLANPVINSIGANSTIFRYGNVIDPAAITQESTTGSVQAGSSIEWKYYTSAAATPTTMFGFANNTFSVGGALTASGIATFNSNATILGAGATRGKFFIGTTTTQPSLTGLEIQATNATLAHPNIYVKSASTGMIRFAGTSGEEGFFQSVDPSGTPSSAVIRWTHISSAAGNPQTPMLELRGNGNMVVRGFTKLGGTAADVPNIKTKLVTGIINSGTTMTTNIAHGLDASKIISINVVIVAGPFGYVSGTENVNPGIGFRAYFDGTNVVILRLENDATSNLDSQNCKVYITYTDV